MPSNIIASVLLEDFLKFERMRLFSAPKILSKEEFHKSINASIFDDQDEENDMYNQIFEFMKMKYEFAKLKETIDYSIIVNINFDRTLRCNSVDKDVKLDRSDFVSLYLYMKQYN